MAKTWEEYFEASPGTDESWSGGSVSAGCTRDPDCATSGVSGAPADWDDDCLEATIDDVGDAAYYQQDFAGSPDPAYFHFEFIVPSLAQYVDSGDYICILYMWDDTWGQGIEFQISSDGSNPRLFGRFRAGGAPQEAWGPILSANTRYKVDAYWNDTGNAWEWRVDGETIDSGTEAIADAIGVLQLGICAGRTSTVTGTIYIDNFYIDNADWPPSAGAEEYTATGSNRYVGGISRLIDITRSESGAI